MTVAREKEEGPCRDPGRNRDLIFNGICLHDKDDPQAQAVNWVVSQVGRDVDMVAVLGLGRGYHLEALRARRPQARILVWEPFPEIEREYLARQEQGAGLEQDGVEIVNSLAELKSKIGQALIYHGSAQGCGLLIPEPYKTLAPDQARELKLALKCLDLRRKTNIRTIQEFGSVFLSNFEVNFELVLQTAEAAAAANALEGLPALIVAAGPSLTDSLGEIKGAQGRAVIICVGTAFKTLLQEGIRPDVVVMIEPRDRSGQVAGAPELESVILASSSVGHPNHLRQKSALNLVFHPQEWLSQLVGDWGLVPDGGNVGSVAFTLAVLWGCDPIIMAGQDLAYSRGKRYARGAGKEPDRTGLIRIPGNKGEQVQTSPEFISYLSWYEESAEYLSRTRPTLKLINATAGGARIDGFCPGSIGAALAGRPALEPGGRQRLVDALGGFKRDMDLVRLRLAQFRREVAYIIEVLEDGSTPFEEIRDMIRTSPLGAHLGPIASLNPGLTTGENFRWQLSGHLIQLAGLATLLQRKARSGLS